MSEYVRVNCTRCGTEIPDGYIHQCGKPLQIDNYEATLASLRAQLQEAQETALGNEEEATELRQRLEIASEDRDHWLEKYEIAIEYSARAENALFDANAALARLASATAYAGELRTQLQEMVDARNAENAAFADMRDKCEKESPEAFAPLKDLAFGGISRASLLSCLVDLMGDMAALQEDSARAENDARDREAVLSEQLNDYIDKCKDAEERVEEWKKKAEKLENDVAFADGFATAAGQRNVRLTADLLTLRHSSVRVDVLLRAIRFFRRMSWIWFDREVAGATSVSSDAHALVQLEEALLRKSRRSLTNTKG